MSYIVVGSLECLGRGFAEVFAVKVGTGCPDIGKL